MDPSSMAMFTCMFFFFAIVFTETLTIHKQTTPLPPKEVTALKEISMQIGKRNWNFNLDPCDGNPNWATPPRIKMPFYNNTVVCDCSYPGGVCHIVAISLKGQDLDGVLPASLAKLPYIKSIELTRNYLSGTIPHEWASTKLEKIDLLVNRLSGRIPTFLGNITSLVSMNLENNMFSGTVPAELGKLQNLKTLILSANNLSGELPMELDSLTNLTELKLNSNNLTGKIPSLANWIQLQKLHIQASGLEGPIPESISLLKNLKELIISDLYGNGSQFPNLSSMTSLEKLVLRSCNITGTIPDYMSEMSKLRHLDLSFNNFEGDIPDLEELDLEKMYLTGNSFNGSIPAWIRGGDTAHDIDLSYNRFLKETVPETCRESLNLFRSYTSESDTDLGKCLSRFPCLNHYTALHINCGGPSVTVGNRTYEADQESGGAAKFFPFVDKWGTSSTGDAWGTKHRVSNYLFDNTSIHANNASKLYATARLSPLSLTYYGRCLKNGNYNVTLHFAEIVFSDDHSFRSLGRRIFDVYVQGVCIFKNFDIKNEAVGPLKKEIKDVLVTNRTLEIRFQYAGKGTTAVPHRGTYGPLICAISMESDVIDSPIHGKNKIRIIIVVAGTVFLLFIILGIAWLGVYIRGRMRRERDLRGLDLQGSVFTYRQIRAATDNFAQSNKLGQGGFGAVYKGTLSDGTRIAVKRLSPTSRQGYLEFLNEIEMIASMQHPNVVRLYGSCSESDYPVLIYEYMENNSLAHVLFGNENSSLQLDWPTRQRICIGIAKGLSFLHEESSQSMVHRDIKPANILLDADLNPKIADFGLARLYDLEEITHISCVPAGTVGYMAPEYASSGYLTYKADVYSFGVVALEIVAGTKNLNREPNQTYDSLLHKAAALQRNGSSLDLVDPILGSDFNADEAERMIQIALLCTSHWHNDRPSMSDVVDMLEFHTIIHDSNIRAAIYHGEFWSGVLGDDIQHM